MVTVDPFGFLTVTPRVRSGAWLSRAQQCSTLGPEAHQIIARTELARIPERTEGHVPEAAAIMIMALR